MKQLKIRIEFYNLDNSDVILLSLEAFFFDLEEARAIAKEWQSPGEGFRIIQLKPADK